MKQPKLDCCNACGSCGSTCHGLTSLPPLAPVRQPIPLRQIRGDEFHNVHLLVAAGCAPFACADFHQRFLRKRVPVIACPNEIGVDCTATLCALFAKSTILTVTIVRMEQACCAALEAALGTALEDCGKFIPWRVITLRADGQELP